MKIPVLFHEWQITLLAFVLRDAAQAAHERADKAQEKAIVETVNMLEKTWAAAIAKEK